jgi:hypothetical protein
MISLKKKNYKKTIIHSSKLYVYIYREKILVFSLSLFLLILQNKIYVIKKVHVYIYIYTYILYALVIKVINHANFLQLVNTINNSIYRTDFDDK